MALLRFLGKGLLVVVLAVLTFEVSFRLAGALDPVDRGDAALTGDPGASKQDDRFQKD